MSQKKRRRPVHLHVMVSEEELALIRERMAEAGVRNLGAYVRKMALNGYVLHVDLSPVRELVSLQRRCSNNLNQVAIQANTYGGIYPEEIKALQRDYIILPVYKKHHFQQLCLQNMPPQVVLQFYLYTDFASHYILLYHCL